MGRLVNPFEQFCDSAGDPLVAGTLDFFESGSSTVRKTTFADAALTIPNPNPVVLLGDGRCPNVFGIGSYRAILKDSLGTQIIQRDPIGGDLSIEFGADWVSTTIYNVGDVVRDGERYYQSKTSGNVGNQPSIDGGVNWSLATFSSGIYNSVDILKAQSVQAGTRVSTRSYYEQDLAQGGAEYDILTLQEVRDAKGEPAWVPDEYGDHTLANGNVAVLQFSESVNVKQCGAVGDGASDDTDAFSSAASHSNLVEVPFSSDGYNVTSSVAIGSSMCIFLGGFITTQLVGTATRYDVNGISVHNGQVSLERLRVEPKPNELTGSNEGSKRGIFVSHSEPDTSSLDLGDGPWAFNEVTANWSGARTGTGIDGGDTSATVSCWSVSLNAGGPDYDLQSAKCIAAGVVHDTADTSSGDKVGVSSGVKSSATSLGKIYGGSFSHTLETGSSTPLAVGVEVDSFINSPGVATDALGFNALSAGQNIASRSHAAYAMSRSGAAGAAGWKTGFLLYSQSGALPQPLLTSASLFESDDTAQLANIFDFGNVTVTGSIMNFPNYEVTGDGDVDARYVTTRVRTVANLIAAATAGVGARSMVSDATSTTFSSVVSGGGSNIVPVYSDGINWRIG